MPISAIREEFENAGEAFSPADGYRLRGHGLPHPGHDLWAFPRSWVPCAVRQLHASYRHRGSFPPPQRSFTRPQRTRAKLVRSVAAACSPGLPCAPSRAQFTLARGRRGGGESGGHRAQPGAADGSNPDCIPKPDPNPDPDPNPNPKLNPNPNSNPAPTLNPNPTPDQVEMVERRGVVVAKLLDQTSAAGCGSMVRTRRPGSGMTTHAQDSLARLSLSLSLSRRPDGGRAGHLRPEAPWRMRTVALCAREGELSCHLADRTEAAAAPCPPAQSRR